MDLATATWLVLGFGLGLVHAFDADHVMALSVYATREPSPRRAIRAGLHWAAGHGAVLLLAGAGLLMLGRALPAALSTAAEHMVGVVMIGLGIYVWYDLLGRRAHLHFHVHDDLPPHAHWHVHEDRPASRASASPGELHHHHHGPVLVGALHGLAGSAPLLAVLPASARSSALGLAYLGLFVLGVALAMTLVSGLIGRLVERLAAGAQGDSHARGISVLRALSASGSIALGTVLAVTG